MSVKNRRSNIKSSHALGFSFFVASVFVMMVSGVVNWSMRLSKGFSSLLDNALTRKTRTFFNMSIFRNHLHPTVLGFCPDVVETFWISVMFLYSILSFCIIGYKWYENDPSFTSYQSGTLRNWGNRSYILFSYQLPLLFLFAGRNNFFQWTPNFRPTSIDTVSPPRSAVVSYVPSLSMQSGNTGTRSFLVPRHPCCHVPLDRLKTRQQSALRAVLLDWLCHLGLLQVICLCRIALNGVHTTTVEFFPGHDATTKVHVKKSKLYKQFSPSSHAFISVLSKNSSWQDYPFTAYKSVTDPETIIFCCRVKKVITRTIADNFKGSDVQTMQVRVLLEGFYGEQFYYQHYDKLVFIVGNTGIVGLFSHVESWFAPAWLLGKCNSIGVSEPTMLWKGLGRNTESTGQERYSKVYLSQPERSSVNPSIDSTDSDHKNDEGEGVKATGKKLISQESEIDLQQDLEFVEIIHGTTASHRDH